MTEPYLVIDLRPSCKRPKGITPLNEKFTTRNRVQGGGGGGGGKHFFNHSRDIVSRGISRDASEVFDCHGVEWLNVRTCS